jgi:galactoside O-acetyltransferase
MIKKIYQKLIYTLLSPIPTRIGERLRYVFYKPLFKRSSGYFKIGVNVEILGFENIELGHDIYFANYSHIYANDKGSIKIGDNFGMNYNSQLGAAFGKIIIGNDCAIAPNCVLRASNHRFEASDIPMIKQGHSYGEIILKDDIWIASNCVITANTTIGRGSVIGAGSVVTKDVPAYSIMGGVPATLIRKRSVT